jgi:hypothetical protein
VPDLCNLPNLEGDGSLQDKLGYHIRTCDKFRVQVAAHMLLILHHQPTAPLFDYCSNEQHVPVSLGTRREGGAQKRADFMIHHPTDGTFSLYEVAEEYDKRVWEACAKITFMKQKLQEEGLAVSSAQILTYRRLVRCRSIAAGAHHTTCVQYHRVLCPGVAAALHPTQHALQKWRSLLSTHRPLCSTGGRPAARS